MKPSANNFEIAGAAEPSDAGSPLNLPSPETENHGSPWYSQLVDCGADSNILCLPYAGMGAAVFGGWRTSKFEAANLYAALLPGRDGRLRETPIETASELVQPLAQAVIDGPLGDRPLTLVGCSFGGVIAFELARRLRDLDHPVQCLVAAACRPPSALGVTEPVASLPDDEMVHKLQHWYAAIPAEIANNKPMLELVLPAIRADMRVYETYDYTQQAPLDCPIVALGASEDRIVTVTDLNGWRKETTGKFTSRQFAGDHFFMKNQFAPVLRYIGRQINVQ